MVPSWNPDRVRQAANENGLVLEAEDVKLLLKEQEQIVREEIEMGA